MLPKHKKAVSEYELCVRVSIQLCGLKIKAPPHKDRLAA